MALSAFLGALGQQIHHPASLEVRKDGPVHVAPPEGEVVHAHPPHLLGVGRGGAFGPRRQRVASAQRAVGSSSRTRRERSRARCRCSGFRGMGLRGAVSGLRWRSSWRCFSLPGSTEPNGKEVPPLTRQNPWIAGAPCYSRLLRGTARLHRKRITGVTLHADSSCGAHDLAFRTH